MVMQYKKAPTVGIDLGTTFSRIAIFQNGKPYIIPNDVGESKIPSFVAFTDKQRLIGDLAKIQITRNQKNTVFDIKRLIGCNFEDREVQDDIKSWPFKVIKNSKADRPIIQITYQNQEKKFFIEEILAIILQKLKQDASDFLGKEVRDAIITVPNFFNNSQRQIVKDAGTISGLNVLRVIDESTLAGIVYCIDNLKKKKKKKM